MAKSRKHIAARNASSKRKAGARHASRTAAKRAPLKKGKSKVRRTTKNAIRPALEESRSIETVVATQLIAETPVITTVEPPVPDAVDVQKYETIQSASSESGLKHGAPGPASP
jgi:hypothetical protein